MEIVHCSDEFKGSRADRRRQQLLDTARRLFVEQGFHGTGVAQIAAVSGIAVGQIYRDFESKEAIVAAIAERDSANFLDEAALCSAVAAGSTNGIRAWISRFGSSDKSIEQCRLFSEILAESGRNARIRDIHRALDARVRANLTAALGALAPDVDETERACLTDVIMAIGSGLTMRRILDPDLDVTALARHLGGIIDGELDKLAR